MSGLEDRILTLVKDLEEEKRLADKRAKQLYLAGGGGNGSFIGHNDTPASYAGGAGKFVKVNATPDALVFANLAAGDLPAHSHVRANISDFWDAAFWASIPDKPSTFIPSAHALVGTKHTASGLTIGHVVRATGATTFAWAELQHGDLGGVGGDDHHAQSHTLASHSTKAHSELTGITSDQHHAQLHASEHEVGGGDLISHDDLTDFVAAEHLSLPNTIGNVLSDHDKATHDALNIDADTLDGLHALSFVRIDGASISESATNLAVGWYTVAVNIGDRAIARFGLRDTASSRHQSALFYASHHYGTHSEITVYNSGRYGVTPFRYIRIKEGGLYDGALLQIYVDDASNILVFYILGDNFQTSGWVIKDFVPDDTDPGGVNNFAALTNVAAQIDLDQIMDGGIVTTGPICAGGDTTQYEVWHAGNDGSGSGLDADTVDGEEASEIVTNARVKAHFPDTLANILSDHNLAAHTTLGLFDEHSDVDHNQTTNYAANQHVVLPGTIANVLSNHSLAIHNALALTELGTIGTGVWQGTSIAVAYTDAKCIDADADETAANETSHADVLVDGDFSSNGLMKRTGAGTYGIVADASGNWNTAFGWGDHAGGGYAVSGGAEHDGFSDFVAAEHKSLPNTIAEVLSDHNLAIHNALSIDHGSLGGKGDDDHSQYLLASGARALSAAWDAGGYQIRALKFYSDQATGVAPFTVLSTTKVTNLNADLLEGYHASMAAGNNTVVVRNASGYIYCNWLNTLSGEAMGDPTHYFVETGNDSFLRQSTPANMVAQLAADGLMPKSGGAFTGLVTARNHGTAAVDELVNVCYGTGDPPDVETVTEGTIYIRHSALGHTHVKADITDTPWAWADVLKTGASLADLPTRSHADLQSVTPDQHHPQSHTLASHSTKPHSALTDISSGQHHDQLHASEHEVGGGDLISHDDLTDFVAAEHLSLPNSMANVINSGHDKAAHDALNIDADTVDGEEASEIVTNARVKAHFPDTIANILSNHTLAVHNALALTELGIIGTGIWQGTAIGWTYVSKTGSNLTDLVTRLHSSLQSIGVNDHHAQLHGSSHHSGGGDAVKLDNLAAPDDNVDLNASTTKHGLLLKLGGGTANFLRADGTWAAPTAGDHASEHEVGGGDLVSHDSLTDFVAAEHKSLPGTIANVLSDHNVAAHNALSIDHGSLGGKEDDDHSQYYNAARHTKAVHDALLITVLGSGALAKDHGAAATDMLVNVCYGTGDPPDVGTVTEGTIYIKYTV